MTPYYTPLVQFDGPRAADAITLAGGPCWFGQVRVQTRDGADEVVPADAIPADVLDRLTADRAEIAGLSMDRARLMGILNVTPDSFSDGGAFLAPERAAAHAAAMVAAGADILDIGGESTRPGAATVPVADEIARTQPVIAAIADMPISIDTRKAEVAEAAIAAGAGLINDVAALSYDTRMAQVVAESGLPVCLMHAQGDPATMQDDPTYDHVLFDVYDFLEERISRAVAAGISRDRIVVDPGIGFGKTVAHNLALLQGLALFHTLGCPILLGASRKRFISALGGGETAQDRLAGSVAVALQGLRQGVQILRVHDIFETKQAIQLATAIKEAAGS